MNKILAAIISMALFSATTNAQTLSIDAESGNIAEDQANCWAFGEIGYSSKDGQTINGKWSMYSNTPSSLDPSSCYIKSPWLKPVRGKITLTIKFESESDAKSRQIIASYITYNAAANESAEGRFVRFDSTSFDLPLSTTNQEINFPVPEEIIKSGLPYKIQLSFVGNGGTSRYIIDDISLPGNYFSDPSNNCLPILDKADTDGDGVIDSEDAYPDDATRAYNTLIPGKSEGTLMFEDYWPRTGDYDFNDLVLGYRYTIVTNANNNVVELKGQAIIRAIGANFENGFGIQLDNLSPELIKSVTGVNTKSPSWLKVNANGTEAGQTYANIIVIDNASRIVPKPAGNKFVNALPGELVLKPATINFEISFAADKVSIDQIAINPYLIINQNRSNEVHLADKAPTDRADTKQFGTQDDDSKIEAKRFYKDKNNLPWALDLPAFVPYSIEAKNITSAYLLLTKWAASSGRVYTDWYLDIPGYRDASIIFQNK
ncbi:MAG: LruC domain-containing protein [Sphingobacteriia bacterium]|jgi:LruC domain-containing protein